MLEPERRWAIPAPVAIPDDLAPAVERWGLARPLTEILVRRRCSTSADVDRFLGPAEAALHDPALLPDAGIALRRVEEALARGERVLVVGDFDADGLSALVLLAGALRRKGLPVLPFVPDRLIDGHGLPVRAVERAVESGCRLIITVDCGTSSAQEIALAARAGIDVIVTDHHAMPEQPPAPLALVNPRRPDSPYPEHRLTGSGVAFKFAQLLLGGGAGAAAAALDLADLAAIGTVSDVAPLMGENRAIVRLGLEQMRRIMDHPRDIQGGSRNFFFAGIGLYLFAQLGRPARALNHILHGFANRRIFGDLRQDMIGAPDNDHQRVVEIVG